MKNENTTSILRLTNGLKCFPNKTMNFHCEIHVLKNSSEKHIHSKSNDKLYIYIRNEFTSNICNILFDYLFTKKKKINK